MTIQLPLNWCESEKGNTMLVNDDYCMVTWIEIDENLFMEISDTPDNNPRFYVGFIKTTKQRLRLHVANDLEGWDVIRWNLNDHDQERVPPQSPIQPRDFSWLLEPNCPVFWCDPDTGDEDERLLGRHGRVTEVRCLENEVMDDTICYVVFDDGGEAEVPARELEHAPPRNTCTGTI